MPLETADYISELNPAWPLGADNVSQGDDHLRVTKRAMQQSFPNVDKEVSATADDLNAITDNANTGVLVPTGVILPYAAATPPNGYLLCDGAAIDPQFSDLIALIGPNTPNLRGQFLRGWSDDSSVDPDGPRAPLVTQLDELGSHQHPSAGAHTHSVDLGQAASSSNRAAQANNINEGSINTGSAGAHQHPATGGPETRPVNITVAYIIKT